MSVAIFRTLGKKDSILAQEKEVSIIAKNMNDPLTDLFVDFSPPYKCLEERNELKEFLHGLKRKEKVFVFDIQSLSNKPDEIAKILTCLFKKDSSVYICSKRVHLTKNTPSYITLGLINELRDEFIKNKKDSAGRPLGSVSKSKFDPYKAEILSMLEDGLNVSEIARRLEVNRSSLKDYINSRGLKELALASKEKKVLFLSEDAVIQKIAKKIECPLKLKKEKTDGNNSTE